VKVGDYYKGNRSEEYYIGGNYFIQITGIDNTKNFISYTIIDDGTNWITRDRGMFKQQFNITFKPITKEEAILELL
jgi:hypothetical protein